SSFARKATRRCLAPRVTVRWNLPVVSPSCRGGQMPLAPEIPISPAASPSEFRTHASAAEMSMSSIPPFVEGNVGGHYAVIYLFPDPERGRGSNPLTRCDI